MPCTWEARRRITWPSTWPANRAWSGWPALAGLIGLVISWWCLRSVKLVAIVLTAGVYSAMASLAFVWYSGGEMNAIVLTMPSLVYVAAISGAIHLANYYRDSIHEGGLEGAAMRAIMHAWLPLTPGHRHDGRGPVDVVL